VSDRAIREQALRAAYEAHAASVAALAARLLRDPEAARDVCQEALVRYFDRMEEVRGDAGPWLRAVATRIALDRIRRGKLHARAVAAIARRPGPEAFDATVEAEDRDRVIEALAALPDRQREVVALRVVEEETFPAIAAALGIAEGSAKEHYRRGMDKLRGLLE
jgi:RNA polymerase sigma factor (sigma-70 family)